MPSYLWTGSLLLGPDSNTNVTLFLVTKLKWQLSMKGLGNVLLTSEIPYEKGRFRYLDAVGGADAKAGRKAYIIYPNGKADVTSSFLFSGIIQRLPRF
jgi:hypothetical protein